MRDRTYRLALRLLGEQAGAEDVAAEALARAYAHWSTLENAPHRDGWVLRVTTNLALDALRRKPPPAPRGEPVDVAEVAVLRTTLVAALRRLPRRQREVVVLRYLAGLTEAEIARALEMAEGTVKSHAHRALKALRIRLGDTQLDEVIQHG